MSTLLEILKAQFAKMKDEVDHAFTERERLIERADQLQAEIDKLEPKVAELKKAQEECEVSAADRREKRISAMTGMDAELMAAPQGADQSLLEAKQKELRSVQKGLNTQEVSQAEREALKAKHAKLQEFTRNGSAAYEAAYRKDLAARSPVTKFLGFIPSLFGVDLGASRSAMSLKLANDLKGYTDTPTIEKARAVFYLMNLCISSPESGMGERMRNALGKIALEDVALARAQAQVGQKGQPENPPEFSFLASLQWFATNHITFLEQAGISMETVSNLHNMPLQ